MKKTVVAVTVLLFIEASCLSQSWSNLGVGLGAQVNALTVYNGTLYAGGAFTMDGGTTSVSHIAKWNGSSWSAVGGGLNGDVYALAVYNSALYAAGNFTLSGTTTLNHIGKWNGSTWASVDSGLNNFANCLFVFNNELYAGGAFTTAGGSETVNRVAKWDGTAWTALANGITGGIVNAIAEYNNEIYIGGTFAGLVKKFDGVAWSAVGSANGIEVKCLAAWGPNGATSGSTYQLYAGGDINVPSAGMIRWNGTAWSSVIQPFNSTGKPLTFCPTYFFLYAGGGFNINVAGHQVKSVAKFEYTHWDSVGTGMDGDVLSLVAFNGELHAGGGFQNADGASAKRVARRTIPIGIEETGENSPMKNFFPNPMFEKAFLKIQSALLVNRPALKVFDLTGREINPDTEILSFNKFNHEIEYRIDRSGLPAGIYFYRLSDQNKAIASGKFVIE